MTLSECREAAMKGLPVVHTAMISCHVCSISYIRISEVGFRYNDKGEEMGFVQLLDKNKHSVTYADPADVVLEVDFKNMQKEKEKESA